VQLDGHSGGLRGAVDDSNAAFGHVLFVSGTVQQQERPVPERRDGHGRVRFL
jgi:hypothetical protein